MVFYSALTKSSVQRRMIRESDKHDRSIDIGFRQKYFQQITLVFFQAGYEQIEKQ